jgi:hypothetical protein
MMRLPPSFCRQRFNGGFTVFLVGSFDLDAVRPLVAYLGNFRPACADRPADPGFDRRPAWWNRPAQSII